MEQCSHDADIEPGNDCEGTIGRHLDINDDPSMMLRRMGALCAALAVFVPVGRGLEFLEQPVPAWYLVAAVACAATFLGSSLLSHRGLLRVAGTASIWVGPLAIATLAYYTGGIESPCAWFLLIPVFWIGRDGQLRQILAVNVMVALMLGASTFDAEPDETWRVAVILAFSICLSSSEYKDYHRRQRALAVLQSAHDTKRSLLVQSVRSSENERRRVAAEIHDGPIQDLTAFGYLLEHVRVLTERGDVEAANDAIQELSPQLQRNVEALRATMSELRPPVLDEQGLADALSDYSSAFGRRHDLDCTVKVQLRKRLDESIELVVYRLVQESLVNVAKHAHATTAAIVVHEDNGGVRVTVQDNGRGFVAHEGHEYIAEGHFGLMGMKERAEMAGGTFRVESVLGRGTTTHAFVPTFVPKLEAA